MSSMFSGLIAQREIKKHVDQSVGGDNDLSTPQIAIKNTIVRGAIKPTDTAQTVQDVLDSARNAQKQIALIIDEVTRTNSGNPVFTSYFNAVKLANFNPAELLVGNAAPISLPPANALKVVERAVFRTQTDPRAILVKDLYRTQAQAGAVEYVYDRTWSKATQSNQLYAEIPSSNLSKLMFAKDKQFVDLALSQAKEISQLTVPGLTEGFFDNIAEMIYATTNSVGQLGAQIDFLSKGRINDQFDQYYSLDQSIETILGSMVDYSYYKMISAKEAAIYFGVSPSLLKATDNLEVLSNPIAPVQELYSFRKELDERLLNSLRRVEEELLTLEGKIVQVFEVRSEIMNTINRAWVLKDMVSASSSFSDFSNLDFSNPDKVIRSLSTVVDRVRGAISLSRRIKVPTFSEKEVAAASILDKWSYSIKN